MQCDYVELVRARLSDSFFSKTSSVDAFGNPVFVKIQLFTDQQIQKFIEMSLLRLNCFLNMMNLKLVESEVESSLFGDMIVQGAVIVALASKALIERGREIAFEDKGVVYTPPDVSRILMDQWHAELADYRFKIDFLYKQSSKE